MLQRYLTVFIVRMLTFNLLCVHVSPWSVRQFQALAFYVSSSSCVIMKRNCNYCSQKQCEQGVQSASLLTVTHWLRLVIPFFW